MDQPGPEIRDDVIQQLAAANVSVLDAHSLRAAQLGVVEAASLSKLVLFLPFPELIASGASGPSAPQSLPGFGDLTLCNVVQQIIPTGA